MPGGGGGGVPIPGGGGGGGILGALAPNGGGGGAVTLVLSDGGSTVVFKFETGREMPGESGLTSPEYSDLPDKTGSISEIEGTLRDGSFSMIRPAKSSESPAEIPESLENSALSPEGPPELNVSDTTSC